MGIAAVMTYQSGAWTSEGLPLLSDKLDVHMRLNEYSSSAVPVILVCRMTRSDNPYLTESQNAAIGLTLKQMLVAGFVGIVVLVSSALTMSGFLFGVIVALRGQTGPSPVPARELLAGVSRVQIGAAVGGIGVIALLLAISMTARIMRMQRALQEAGYRRLNLASQLSRLRAARLDATHVSLDDSIAPGQETDR
jgi:hypothetical protein